MTGIQETPGGAGAAAEAEVRVEGPGAARHAAEPSLGELVSQASENLSTLVRSEIELAKLELRSSFKNAGVGGGMFAGAGVILAYSMTFGFIALALGLFAAGLFLWLSFLIVFGAQLVVVAILVFVGVRKVKKVKAPQRTIESSKETVAYLRKHG